MIDQSTGEVRGMVPYQEQKRAPMTVLDNFVNGQNIYICNEHPELSGLPIEHLLMSTRTDLDFVQQTAMLSEYTGTPPKSMGDCLGTVWNIMGIAVAGHGEFTHTDGTFGDAYNYFLLKTDQFEDVKVMVGDRVEKMQQPVIIKTSATQQVQFFLGIARSYGWFNWKQPLPFVFYGAQSTGYFARQYMPQKAK